MFDVAVTPVGSEIQEGVFESLEVEFLGFSAAAGHHDKVKPASAKTPHKTPPKTQGARRPYFE